MTLQKDRETGGVLSVNNIGGIEETAVEFPPGVTLLVGRNATNRSSFLQAIMAALGSENVAIKGDADESEVELTLGDETYTRLLRRKSGNVIFGGEPFLDDSELADLFAFLLESNEARRAVTANTDLRELIMRPIDTGEIQAETERLVQTRDSLKQELEEIAELKGKLPGLEEKRADLESQIDKKKQELKSYENRLDDVDVDVEKSKQNRSQLEEKLTELRAKRSKLDDVRYDLDTERESLEALTREQRKLEDEKMTLPDSPIEEVQTLESEIRELRKNKQRLEGEVNELRSVIGFNEELLDEAGANSFTEFTITNTGNVSERLLEDGEVNCWTCGSTVKKDQIETTLDGLRERSQEKVSEINEMSTEVEEALSKKHEHEEAQRERDRISQRLSETESKITQTEDRIESLQKRREGLTETIESIEAEIQALENENYNEVLDIHKEANEIEYELGGLETELDQVESNISEIESQITTQGELEAQVAEVSGEIESLRTKIERLEQKAVNQFNEHMDIILDLLDYENLDRIWIEQVERDAREGRRTVTRSAFELHVIRSSTSGVAYEDTVDHLSESEREVTGLVFALAGYLAHEVYDDVPFMLLDSLESIDSDRIVKLVEYFKDYTKYLFVALLPEDAMAFDGSYTRIKSI